MPSALACQRSSGLKDFKVDIISGMEALMLDSHIMKMHAKHPKAPPPDTCKFVVKTATVLQPRKCSMSVIFGSFIVIKSVHVVQH